MSIKGKKAGIARVLPQQTLTKASQRPALIYRINEVKQERNKEELKN
jgi:hypothetical protein